MAERLQELRDGWWQAIEHGWVLQSRLGRDGGRADDAVASAGGVDVVRLRLRLLHLGLWSRPMLRLLLLIVVWS
eukprot:4443971-Pyramimonas_sp.AAC.1